MAGDTSNATVWPDADVYIGPTTATNPADITTEFSSDWDLVGLLDGDAGFTQGREEQTNDIYAWGGILVRTTRRNFKQTITFTALEDNATTKALIWPGSENGDLIVPRPERLKVAFEMVEGDNKKRLISAHEAEIVINGDITDNESDLTRYELMATIFPNASGVLFVEQSTVGASS